MGEVEVEEVEELGLQVLREVAAEEGREAEVEEGEGEPAAAAGGDGGVEVVD